MDIEWIKDKVKNSQYEFSSHADREREFDKISISEVEKALLEGEIIEDYPQDPRGESSLILGYGDKGYPIHIVCGKTPRDKMRVITVYIPTLPKWLDPKTRYKKETK